MNTLRIISSFTSILLICLAVRYWMVCQFEEMIVDLVNNSTLKLDVGDFYSLNKLELILDKYPYDEMLYSFKPLKLKYWFTDEEIKLLMNGNC
jgi:hypothetical protein